jgi:hypothetical protein
LLLAPSWRKTCQKNSCTDPSGIIYGAKVLTIARTYRHGR